MIHEFWMLVILGAPCLAGIGIGFFLVRKKREQRIVTAQSNAQAKREKTYRELNALAILLDLLEGKINKLVAWGVDHGELAEPLSEIESFKRILTRALVAINNLKIDKNNNPDGCYSSEWQYKSIESSYWRVSQLLDRAGQKKEDAEKALEKLEKSIAETDAELEKLAKNIDGSNQLIKTAAKAGFEVQGFRERLSAALGNQQTAKKLAKAKKYSKAQALIDRTKGEVYQVTVDVGDLERRRNRVFAEQRWEEEGGYIQPSGDAS